MGHPALPLSSFFQQRLRAHFRRGGLIAYATESCFGLGCDPANPGAVRRLLRLKGRPQDKGLILIAATLQQLRGYIAPLSELQQRQVCATWPGPHTWLVAAGKKTGRRLRGEHPTLAVRVTAHPGAAALCRVLGSPLVSTSANRAGHVSLKTAAACRKAFGRKVLVVPGRIGREKKPSTIHDLASGRIIRD
ncbi:MAG: L-threonylcarbamoyladenylate synthase [Sulfuricella sp.]|nr:L-threonylcarbamoyladenylate synthase [Sulfuricella sp.]